MKHMQHISEADLLIGLYFDATPKSPTRAKRQRRQVVSLSGAIARDPSHPLGHVPVMSQEALVLAF
jgi:hypothetical protein